MSGSALALVVVAAIVHATWNLLNKRASGHATFTWIVAGLSALLYAPVAIIAIVYWQARVDLAGIGFMVGSAVLHTGYFLVLNEGYRAGDLSLVYPLARGTGPLLSTLLAIILLGERPSALAIGGGLMIISGVIILTGNPARLRNAGSVEAIGYALVTGTFIAAYTVWDKQAVSRFAVTPVLLDWGANSVRALLLLPLALSHWQKTRVEWSVHRFEAIAVALLVPLSYILVLTAMQFTPVSYVAPAREISILLGTAMGTGLLAEGNVPRRLIGACAMVLGVVVLAVG